MNPELQYKFEKQMMDSDIITDRRLFNKDTKGSYLPSLSLSALSPSSYRDWETDRKSVV